MQPKNKGQLKIFFGYAESIGKTPKMLKAAQMAREQGMNVLVGYLAPHTSKDILELLKDFPQLPPLKKDGCEEFDLDQALLKKPDLVLVDDLGHTNGKICRHHKRYQDIDELLKSGINVYTTANVGNIESLQDIVASITGKAYKDRIPDFVFDNADQVELIDAEPLELIERLREHNTPDSQNTIEQLTALREVALRRCADRIKNISSQFRQSQFHTDEHVLVCLSPAPSNARIIRTAARMARAFNSRFTALFIETPDFASDTPENKRRLREHRILAQQLGATVETVYGEDVAFQIAEFIRLSGITKVVLGRSATQRQRFLGKPPLVEQLLSYVPSIDIHIIPDQNSNKRYHPKKKEKPAFKNIFPNLMKSFFFLLGSTLLGCLLDYCHFSNANIIMVYILGVLLTSITTSHRIYSLISSMASVFIFNFLFITPRFSLSSYESDSLFTFVIMFLTAYITGTQAIRYKEQAGQSANVAYRTKILFETNQLLSKANDKDEILLITINQLLKLLGRDIALYEVTDGQLSKPELFPCPPHEHMHYRADKEKVIVEWVLKNNHAAGANTATLSDTDYLYLAIRVNERVYGIVGIEADDNPLDAFEHGILLSILGECALALENDKNARDKEAAAILAESEQLRANLLRTISHDLRTPLTTIAGSASSLLTNGSSFDEKTRQQMYADIYQDSMWLNNLVENLLSATRIEEGRMHLRTAVELMNDVVEDAVQHVRRQHSTHPIHVQDDGNFLLVDMDARLIGQVIVNLIDNAIKYTPDNTPITVSVEKQASCALLKVADAGKGIPDAEKSKVFDKFYCGSHKVADNRRSLGLGLYLCKAIIEEHGGNISVDDNVPHGSVFSFTLPLKEISLHE